MADPSDKRKTNHSRDTGLGYVRANDCWHCTVSDPDKKCDSIPTQNGNCPSGICQPTSGTNRYRVNLHWLLTLLAVAVFAGLFSTKWRSEFIAAGPLSSPHAQILGGQFGSERCQQCHVDSETIAGLTMAESSLAGQHASQSEKCMVCHTNEMPNLERSSPHDLTESMLTSISQLQSKSNSVRLVSTSGDLNFDWRNRELGCGDCHREHNGAGFDLQAISDQKCQSCHQQTFNSFEDNHPEFEDYPPVRTRNIMFDHVRHRDLHFAKSSSTFDCKACHLETDQVTAAGAVTATVSFETACAQCHQDAMDSSLSQGIVVFQLPSLDARQLPQLAELNWPAEASLLNDGTIPPVMQLLLRQNGSGADWAEGLPEESRLDRLNFSKLRDRQAALGLANASKELLEEIASNGQSAIRDRLARFQPENLPPGGRTRFVSRNSNSRGNGDDISQLTPELMQDLLAGIPPQVFEAAFNQWFPDGVSSSRSSGDVISQKSMRDQTLASSSSTFGRARLGAPVSPDGKASANPPAHNSNQRDDLTALPDGWEPRFRPAASDDLLVDDGLSESDSLLGGDDLLSEDGLLGDADAEDDLLSSDSLLDDPLAGDALLNDGGLGEPEPSNRDSRKRIELDSYVSAGGWFIDNRRMAIVYKPTGHADRWLAAWTQLAAALENDSANSLNGRELIGDKYAGNCAECHRSGLLSSANRKLVFARPQNELDNRDSIPLHTVWKSDSISATKRFLTRFDHTPHLLLPGLTDCVGCHSTKESGADLADLEETERLLADTASTRLVMHREFDSISVTNCQQCHQKDAASANCTTCHNYHVDQIRNIKGL